MGCIINLPTSLFNELEYQESINKPSWMGLLKGKEVIIQREINYSADMLGPGNDQTCRVSEHTNGC